MVGPGSVEVENGGSDDVSARFPRATKSGTGDII